MIIFGSINEKEYGVDYNGCFVFGEVKEYQKDVKNKKGEVVNKKGEKYISDPKYPPTMGYAVELFIKQYQGYKVSSLNAGNLQDLVAIFNKSNDIRNQLLEKLK